ncbi:hypothetical protein GUJ14_12240 [Enterococcus hirae]|uniref:hypothetical protein n=2 Tax=Enterococcus hirae TaxID=1354 RepID=UPI000BA8B840|nr:hypothetical protein [Enterococcus hirae]ASV82482.1 hypothetical protein A6J73_10415 [Enterococcus hirae]MDD9146783.1 hypothetical protein [Enterococcus hirae]MEB5734473.1 hypothetical protein [Enterococcus hirae]MEC4729955.1 hypothetical protein [Enterococcus hirae]NAA13374.1 hypothetical protein [Enterococcus hirae]
MKNDTIVIPQEGCHVGDENEEIKGSNNLNEANEDHRLLHQDSGNLFNPILKDKFPIAQKVEVSDNTVHTKRKQMFDEQKSVNLQGWDELYNPLLNGNYTIEQAVKVLGDIYEPKRIRISDEAKSNEHQEQSDPQNRNISDFTEKEIQDKRTKSSKNIPVAQAIKQIDKQPISQTAHSLELALPKKVNKTYPKVDYVQLYQSIQSVITRETFCDILGLSIDTFQKLLEYEEVVPDQSANSESEHIDKKEKLTHKIISTIEELRSREKTEENLNCTNKVKEACVLLWRSERLMQKELCDKLNISDGNLRRWNYRYDQALGNKNTITTLEDLKNRELGPGNLSCPAEVKAACVRLLKNKEMTKKQVCEYYRLVPKTLHNWTKNYELLLKEIEMKSQGLHTFSASIGNAKITAKENNESIVHNQDTSPNLIFGGRT